ncbi:MAG: hypothetical protein HY343_05845 [Lentisphaerae bacterium]|nr:hypothetical protein [Lentisphaerota bacterium]
MSADTLPATEEKKGHGCFFYGCLTSIVIAIVAAVAISLVIMKLKDVAMSFTSNRPADIPVVTLSKEKMAALDARLQAFQQAMKEDKPGRLVLTADEINALLNSSPDFQGMGGKAHVRIAGDQISATLSLPTDFIGLKGRHLNGTAKIRVGLAAGRLFVYVDQLEANDKPIPEAFMKEFRTKNLAEDAMNDPESAATIAKLKSLRVQNGAIIAEK